MATLEQRISDVVTAIGTEIKSVRASIGASSGGVSIQETITFPDENNYVEKTVTNENIKTTSIIVASFQGDEEVAIQAITCGVKSVSSGSCVLWAGTPHGATGTYTINLIIG